MIAFATPLRSRSDSPGRLPFRRLTTRLLFALLAPAMLLGSRAAAEGIWSPFPSAPPPATTPGPRHGMGMILDQVGQRVVVFGGYRSGLNHATNDTWTGTLDPTPVFDSLEIAIAPSPRYGHGAVYDPVRQRMLVFDGRSDTQVVPMDAWELDLSGNPTLWSSVPMQGIIPSGRQGGVAVYDPVRDRVLLFGGYDNVAFHNEVLVFTPGALSSWSILPTAGVPPTGRN